MRSSRCAVFDTLIADEDGVYNGRDPNDRLLLGLKGIMSEMDLHIMHNRLIRGRENKAQRGELFHGIPLGYVILPTGQIDFLDLTKHYPSGETDCTCRVKFAAFRLIIFISRPNFAFPRRIVRHSETDLSVSETIVRRR